MRFPDISKITIVTGQGVKSYTLGQEIGHKKPIHCIRKEPISFTGDPYDHYVGRDDAGNVLFSINCLVPCDIVYM